MLHTVAALIGSSVVASDGAVGRVIDAYFDEQSWQIRYLLVEVSCVGRDRAVLFPPESVVSVDAEEGIRVERLPSFDLPASRKLRSLRSTREVLDCAVSGWTGDLGRTEDALFDEGSWTMRFLMVDASSWCPGVVVFVRPDLVQEARWERQSLRVAVTRIEVLSTPEADPTDVEVAHNQRVLH